MSIIFKTLEKLKNDARQNGSEQLKARKHKNVISLDKIISSLPWLLVAAVLVFATGATIFYVIKDLAYSASGNHNEMVISVSNPEPPAMDNTNESSTSLHINAIESSETEHPESLEDPKNTHSSTWEEIPAPGEAPSAQKPASAAYLSPKHHANRELYQTEIWKQDAQQNLPEPTTQIVSESGKAATVLGIDEADYIPPVSQSNDNLLNEKKIAEQYKLGARTTTSFASAMSQQDLKPDRNSQENSLQKSRLNDFQAVKQIMPEGKEAAHNFSPSNPTPPADKPPDTGFYVPPDMVETLAIHRNVSNSNHAGRQFSGSRYANSKYPGQPPPQNSFHETTVKSQQEKMRLATVEKNYRICQLISEAKHSLLSENDSRTESLLNELSACKGQDDAYVMKLRAFWHLKQGKYESAKALLDLLLMKDENDLEAGINMAVLEIKTNQLGRAQKRLEKLRRLYADNTQIPPLLWKIRKNNPTTGD